jgi:uncharacterized protein (TIRG00374 family)
MRKRKTKKPIVSKIDIDEKTKEPVIVELSDEEFDALGERIRNDKQYDFIEKKSNKSIGKQLAMSRILGIDKPDESTTKRQKLFKTLFTVVFIVFVVGVLFFTAYNDFFSASESRDPFSWSTLWDLFASSWYYLIFALIALGCSYLFKGAKLSVLCKSLTCKFHFQTCFETGIIGTYYNNVTPLAVGGQPFEIYHLSKHGVHGGVASSLPIATYFLNQLAFVIICITGLALAHYNALFSYLPPTFMVLAIIGISFVFIVSLMVLLFALMPRVGATLVNFAMWLGGKLRIIKNPKQTAYKTIKNVVHNAKCLKKISKRPLAFITTFILSFFEHFSGVTIAFFVLKFFGYHTSALSNSDFIAWVQIIHVCSILNAAISFIPTPGNSGAADLSFYLLFELGLMTGLAFPAMVVWRLISFYSTILIGFLFATFKKKSDLKKQAKFQEFAPIEEEIVTTINEGDENTTEEN